jgi:dTDP-4-amino-4,6-dideoxygalactose transaminase
MGKYEYNPWPLGKVPKELLRPELDELKDKGYLLNDARDAVDLFEKRLSMYAGSKYAVVVDCCTHALELALRYLLYKNEIDIGDKIIIPDNTYISIYMMLNQLNFTVSLEKKEWSGIYNIGDTRVIDGAVRFTKGMYIKGSLHCLSFQIKKILCIGRGGAILCDNKEEYDFLKLLSYDGRNLTVPYNDSNHIITLGYHYYLTPEDAARGLIIMDKLHPKNEDSGNNNNYPSISELLQGIRPHKTGNDSKYSNKHSLEFAEFLSKSKSQQMEILVYKYIRDQWTISKLSRLLNNTSRVNIRKILENNGIQLRPEYFIDLTGRKIGDITVVRRSGYNIHGHIMWECRCECGKSYRLESTNLNRNIIHSCQQCAMLRSKSGKWTGFREISGSYYTGLRHGAKTRNIEFAITIEQMWDKFIEQNRRCALSGIELIFNSRGKKNDGNASLDRINNLKGYTVDNIQWVHKDINFMKQDYDEKYFIEMCKCVFKTKGII